jgi:hypothetical protein
MYKNTNMYHIVFYIHIIIRNIDHTPSVTPNVWLYVRNSVHKNMTESVTETFILKCFATNDNRDQQCKGKFYGTKPRHNSAKQQGTEAKQGEGTRAAKGHVTS